ncbi:dimethylamine monooxygenase subunit DmmA family protein [Pseudomonas putida]|uniref:Dimethylamine monooxygenase subunit DmmA-like C-terminal domain-containing protein n=1 Tax=Pseudomonas putida TaxID=303 RepID=A0A1Q9RAG5_PSEPU|nr:dimethylamine monooxygenase subunit DmmA family protein [Pseudomonas putida]OLS64443.1 hypothetical protein PSEMO_07280 [Pseudomonas putida]
MTDHPFSVPRYEPQGRPADLLVTQYRDANLPAGQQLALADFANAAALQRALTARLELARCGLRLELRGDESFIWPLQALARGAGLQDDEILLSRVPGSRQVFCVHCARCQPASAAEVLTCAHCGVRLEVRRHFSQRLGAYLGVCADADQPYAEARP